MNERPGRRSGDEDETARQMDEADTANGEGGPRRGRQHDEAAADDPPESEAPR